MKFIDDSDVDADEPNKCHDKEYDVETQPEEVRMTNVNGAQANSNGTGLSSESQVAASGSRTNVSAASGYKDVGYSWVILGAVFSDYCLIAISLGAVGVLYPHFLQHFQCTKYEAGWIGSLHMAIGALIGLFLSPAIARFGCRPVAMLGSVIGSIGYASSYLSQTVGHMYLTFGLLAGIGNGLIIISSSVVLQQYFDRRRTIATALATTGFGLSPLIVAPVTRWMAATLGWRMAMLLLGCAYLHGAIAGALMKPPPLIASTTAIKLAQVGKNADDLKGVEATNGTTTLDNGGEVQSRGCHLVLWTMMKSIWRTFHLSLLIDIRFIVMTFSTMLSTFGYFAPYVFLPSHAQFGPARLDAASSANLIAVLALSMSVGRISSGLIGDRMSSMICFPASCRKSKERRLFHYALPMTIAGLANAGVLMWRGKAALTLYSAFVGLLTGSYMVMQQPVLIDLLGLQNFAASFGLFMMFNGIASLACQPFAGWLVDVSGSYSLPFLVCGLLQATGGLQLIGLGVFRSCRTSRSSSTQSEKHNGY